MTPPLYVIRKLLRTLDVMRRAASRPPGDRDELVSRLAMLEMMADNAIDYTADLSGVTLADAMADVAPTGKH